MSPTGAGVLHSLPQALGRLANLYCSGLADSNEFRERFQLIFCGKWPCPLHLNFRKPSLNQDVAIRRLLAGIGQEGTMERIHNTDEVDALLRQLRVAPSDSAAREQITAA